MAFFDTEKMYERFDVARPKHSLADSYNVYPGQQTPVIFYEGERKVALKQFGFDVAWSTNPIFNARVETLTEKRMFRNALQEGRCLIPATKYYEWQSGTAGKREYEHEVDGGELFSMAAVCDGDAFAIITTEPWKKLAKIHHRMPVVMQPDLERDWLNPDVQETADLLTLLTPVSESHISYTAV